jgi:hypothetical protein
MRRLGLLASAFTMAWMASGVFSGSPFLACDGHNHTCSLRRSSYATRLERKVWSAGSHSSGQQTARVHMHSSAPKARAVHKLSSWSCSPASGLNILLHNSQGLLVDLARTWSTKPGVSMMVRLGQ